HVHQQEAEEQRDGRGELEVDDRLQSDPAHRLEIAGAGDADDERREDQRRDDHLDHAQEGVGERLDADAERRPQIADRDPEHEPGNDLGRQAAALAAGLRGFVARVDHRAAPDFVPTKAAIASTTDCCWSGVSSPYTGMASVSAAARSAIGKSPRAWPRYEKHGWRWNGTG